MRTLCQRKNHIPKISKNQQAKNPGEATEVWHFCTLLGVLW